MKARHCLIAAAFYSILVSQAALAYYNPQTGRFLSRDPVGELGFQTVQYAAHMGDARRFDRTVGMDVHAVPVVPIHSSGQRYDSPGTGRWISRDPIGEYVLQPWLDLDRDIDATHELQPELPSILYLFVGNAPTDKFDLLGLATHSSDASASRCVGTWGALIHHAGWGKPSAVRRRYFNTVTFPLNCPVCEFVKQQPAPPKSCGDCQVIYWEGGTCTENGVAVVSVGTRWLGSQVKEAESMADALARLAEAFEISYDCSPCGAKH
jgi:hypothetical protein